MCKIVVYGFVRRGKAGVVAACREQLTDLGVGKVADWDDIQQRTVFAVCLWVFLQITDDSVAGKGVP